MLKEIKLNVMIPIGLIMSPVLGLFLLSMNWEFQNRSIVLFAIIYTIVAWAIYSATIFNKNRKIFNAGHYGLIILSYFLLTRFFFFLAAYGILSFIFWIFLK